MIWREKRDAAKTWKKERDEKKIETGLRKPKRSKKDTTNERKRSGQSQRERESKLTQLEASPRCPSEQN